ncbi:hypothetical protein BC826DRAFT_731868 [Russula brevipes]|nr:hypothetical protein BC826DRAFT_731868 [Russula brevipes]
MLACDARLNRNARSIISLASLTCALYCPLPTPPIVHCPLRATLQAASRNCPRQTRVVQFTPLHRATAGPTMSPPPGLPLPSSSRGHFRSVTNTASAHTYLSVSLPLMPTLTRTGPPVQSDHASSSGVGEKSPSHGPYMAKVYRVGNCGPAQPTVYLSLCSAGSKLVNPPSPDRILASRPKSL